MHECGAVPMVYVWRSEDSSVELALSFCLYMDSRDLIQVARLAWPTPIPGKPSYQSSPGALKTSLRVVSQVLLSPQVLLS